jgi:hypothetical protein
VSPLLEFCVCIDDQIPSSCVQGSQPLDRLRSINRKIGSCEGQRFGLSSRTLRDASNIGFPWLQQRIYQPEKEKSEATFAEDPGAFVSDIVATGTDKRLPTACMITLGELSSSSVILDVSMMESPRKPRKTDIYQLKSVWDVTAQ